MVGVGGNLSVNGGGGRGGGTLSLNCQGTCLGTAIPGWDTSNRNGLTEKSHRNDVENMMLSIEGHYLSLFDGCVIFL